MRLETLLPFGARLHGDAALEDLDIDGLKSLVDRHRVVALRGFVAPEPEALLAFARRLGPLMRWEFGALLDVRVEADPRNYVFTEGAVPLHWDGAFHALDPHYQVFQCVAAPAEGGETVFCDTVRALAAQSASRRAAWAGLESTVAIEKRAHFGGTIRARLVQVHPTTGEATLRYAAQSDPDAVNPHETRFPALSDDAEQQLFDALDAALGDAAVTLSYAWRPGDLLIADNFALLHGRRAYQRSAPRHLRRVHVL